MENEILLNCRGTLLDLSSPKVMGVLNITPDSFYEGSRLKTTDEILGQAAQMIEDGASILDIGGASSRPPIYGYGYRNSKASILDIGGASSRPKAAAVLVKEELERVIPVVELLVKHFPKVLLSVDTYQSVVAQEAILAGVHLVNDISAFGIDESLLDVVAKAKIPYVLMHLQGTPQTMQDDPFYEDVLLDVFDFFINKIATLKERGIEDIVLDVGFCFGKTIKHNYKLLANMHIFQSLGKPLLVGVSRKSMIWKVLKNTPEQALNGTTALHVIALQQGAKILRVHDVKAAVETIKLIDLVKQSTQR